MALPTSGQISISVIGLDMGILATNLSLTTLSTVNLNAVSPSKPDGLAPHAISEFYGYDHSASSGLKKFLGSTTLNPKTVIESACLYAMGTDYFSSSSKEILGINDTIYVDSEGRKLAEEGLYHVGQGLTELLNGAPNFNQVISLDRNGLITSITECDRDGGLLDGGDPGLVLDPGNPVIIENPGFATPIDGSDPIGELPIKGKLP